jgi:D-glycero-D-manno-heptose 1,7-bisphosphate phosphatase
MNKGYVYKAEDCEFIHGIFDLVKHANQLDYKVIIVTNQAGIARGYYSEATFLSFSEWMKNAFKQHQASIDDIYYCPHHPEFGLGAYHTNCNCRKPAPGMLIAAQEKHHIDMERSILVGDSLSDIKAAEAANIKYRYLLSSTSSEKEASEDIQTSKQLNLITISSLDKVNLTSLNA